MKNETLLYDDGHHKCVAFSMPEDEESLYVIVSDEEEMNTVAEIFSSLLDDIDLES